MFQPSISSSLSTWQLEVASYILDKGDINEKDPFKWWQLKKTMYPKIYELAIEVLAVITLSKSFYIIIKNYFYIIGTCYFC